LVIDYPARVRGALNLGRRLRASLRTSREQISGIGSFRVWWIHYRGPHLASKLRQRWARFRNPLADIDIHPTVFAGPGFKLNMPHGGTFIVGPGVEFRRGFRADLGPNARVLIGANCRFTFDAVISCDTSIELGERCMVGQNAYFVDGNHRFRDLTIPFLDQGYDYRPIRIDDDAVILSKCTVTNSIGRRSILAANAVATKPIPPYCVAGGVPARVLEYFGPPGLEPPGYVARAASAAETTE
jgi:acetyltransferase-like isoleucine patch superfamily enzyme